MEYTIKSHNHGTHHFRTNKKGEVSHSPDKETWTDAKYADGSARKADDTKTLIRHARAIWTTFRTTANAEKGIVVKPRGIRSKASVEAPKAKAPAKAAKAPKVVKAKAPAKAKAPKAAKVKVVKAKTPKAKAPDLKAAA